LDLLARLVGCHSLEELARTAQASLPELIPQYQADILWRGQTFKQGLALTRASELSWPLTSGLEACGSLKLSTSAGAPLSVLDRELLRLFASQFSCLMEAAELQDNLRLALKQLQQSQVQLVETSKLAAVGQLAAGVAHELNTPLGAITVGCELVQTYLGRDLNKAAERLEGILAAARRMQEIIAKLLLYSSYTGASRRPVDLAEVAADSLLLINQKGINIRLEPSNLARAWANPAEVQQIIHNLLTNAIDAQAHNIELRFEQGQGCVSLHLEDDGTGMPPEVSARVYEPFFSTKAVGKGAGLGLSSSLQLAQQHQGSLSHRTQAGRGTTFTLTLPVQEAGSPRQTG
jgi:signal transduction histidine kinase